MVVHKSQKKKKKKKKPFTSFYREVRFFHLENCHNPQVQAAI